ncbi:30S ribosomal protein S4 [Methylophilus medardicus]|uniref:Small ribosomal subunit protein uS4 n=1 Tax=Methylophilus medardicus TaxID=2588534 RepID=A0A5B8CU96_9PROT|nr:30S ribosomal protein S4 [Methylophilus medardicus]QDC44898.1 30S ribosomal protein S4 [Methylophilus medardicus]QDC49905.1 30S ribosomal protein S4 [Methylophilus medardicus]QDC53610.1 30S ribosomal protein S4 [Methylophilus medardicus]
MARMTGPRLKIMRALGVELPGLSRKSIENRPNPPGQHGQQASRRRRSDFAVKLMEKQKIRFNYGVSEKQMRRLILEARKGSEPTGDKLMSLLERRLDNVVFRAGFAPTGIAARQLVNHGHVLLNGKPVNIASVRLQVGDVVTVKEKSRKIPMVVEALATPSLTVPEWLSVEAVSATAKIGHLPSIEDVPFAIDMQQVVEFYSNRV